MNAAKLGYDPKNGKEIVCVNQALTPNSPPTWEWAQPPPMTTGLNATGSLCDPQGAQIMSRSSDGYLIVGQMSGAGPASATGSTTSVQSNSRNDAEDGLLVGIGHRHRLRFSGNRWRPACVQTGMDEGLTLTTRSS
jgi:hypothetical protein